MSLGQLEVDGERVYWLEGRPSEGGRQVVVRWAPGDGPSDAVGEGWSARTTVHEYGGGAYVVSGDTVFFSHFADQRLYRAEPDQQPRPLTPEPAESMGSRYADARVSPDGRELVCVRERHMDGVAVNDIVLVDAVNGGEPSELVSGADFFMPWDGTELWVAEFGDDGLAGAQRIAGGPEESISQPRWSPDGVLHWVSDRTGWWNLYAEGGDGAEALAPLDAEFTGPDWIFGQSTY
ncbi:MAG: S9 family peptidase, partial [Actinobacteria bacterium]